MVVATVVEKEMESIPSVKDLASSDPALRRKNLQTVISHLESRSATNHLTHTQALQLWRAFHVSLYMHDSKNQLSVQTLIATLADTFRIIRTKDAELSPPTPSTQESTPESRNTNGGEPNLEDNDDDEFAGFNDEPLDTKPAPSNLNDSSWLSTYSTSFWETISREWSTIDQWRMNKYLLLIRFVVREILTICLETRLGVESTTTELEAEAEPEPKPDTPKSKKRKANGSEQRSDGKKSKVSTPVNNTTTKSSSHPPAPTTTSQPNPNTTTSQMSILTLFPLSPRNRAVSDGLRLHVLDIYVDELFRSVAAVRAKPDTDIDMEELKEILTTEFLAPVRGIAADGLNRNVRVRAKGVLADFEARVAEELV